MGGLRSPGNAFRQAFLLSARRGLGGADSRPPADGGRSRRRLDRARGRVAGHGSVYAGVAKDGNAAMDWWRSPDGDAAIRRLAASRVTVGPDARPAGV